MRKPAPKMPKSKQRRIKESAELWGEFLLADKKLSDADEAYHKACSRLFRASMERTAAHAAWKKRFVGR